MPQHVAERDSYLFEQRANRLNDRLARSGVSNPRNVHRHIHHFGRQCFSAFRLDLEYLHRLIPGRLQEFVRFDLKATGQYQQRLPVGPLAVQIAPDGLVIQAGAQRGFGSGFIALGQQLFQARNEEPGIIFFWSSPAPPTYEYCNKRDTHEH